MRPCDGGGGGGGEGGGGGGVDGGGGNGVRASAAGLAGDRGAMCTPMTTPEKG